VLHVARGSRGTVNHSGAGWRRRCDIMNRMRVDPIRYRQTLLDSVTDDGLEELTLRLARDEYPAAHRAGKGKDGGIDVLSDFELPPRSSCKTGC
jgi:hypothetical protein